MLILRTTTRGLRHMGGAYERRGDNTEDIGGGGWVLALVGSDNCGQLA